MEIDKSKLEKEQAELNGLINKGVEFSVTDTEFEVERKFFGLIKKYKPKAVKRDFKIEEPTLSTLDRLSSEWVQIAIDEKNIKSEDGMVRARGLVSDHAIRCARIVAIATLGESRLIAKPGKGGTIWVENATEIDRLAGLFARTIKPSKLYQMCVLINAMCNLGDFTNSIRLMLAERTTIPMPIRIEENNEG